MYKKKSMRHMLLVCICIWNMFGSGSFAESFSNEMTSLSNGEVILDENTVTPLSLMDVGFASMEIPSKSSVLRSWRLHLRQPQGKRISSSKELESVVAKQLTEYVGGVLTSERIFRFLEFYDGLISDEQLKNYKEKCISPEVYSEVVYFAQFRWRSLQVHILGQVDQFLAVFVALPSARKSEYMDICKLLFPKQRIQQMNDATGKVYSRGVCDHHYKNVATDIRTGLRKRGKSEFYGIRMNIDIANIKKNEEKKDSKLSDSNDLKNTGDTKE